MDCKLGRAALVLTFLAVWSGVARATDEKAKVAARNLANAAKRDFDAGHLEDAEVKFRQAFAIARVPTLALWTARVLVKRGRLVAGSELYRQASELTPNDLWIGNAQEKAQADAKRELEALQPRIPKLRIQVKGAAPSAVELTIDDVLAEGAWIGTDVPVDPGRHRIVGKTSAETSERALDLLEGERKEAVLTFQDRTSAAAPVASHGELATASAAKALPVPRPARVDHAANLTTNPLLREPASDRQPFYRKWWFWTGVGAVAIAATVTAIVLARHPGGACGGASYPCVEVQ